MEELLDKYAKLVVGTGVNLQRKQLLVINAPIECADFARRVAAAGYEAGAHDVVICWNDEKFAKLRYTMAGKAVFTEFPEWRRLLYTDYAEQGAAFVSILAEDPEIFQSVDPDKLMLSQKAAGAALLEYRQRLMNNENSWCVVSIPTKAWAAKVFPEMPPEKAIDALWQAIFAAVRIRPGEDPVAAWQAHTEFLQRAADFMNAQRFTSLHYENALGTDLTVELPTGHIWAGGAEYTATKVRFVANMPTEEVYSLPRRDGVNGTVYATKPLNYNGNLIEDICLTFRDGRVVAATASRGEELLQQLIATDDGSAHLGEVALVPFDSPISRSGILFFNTLFDENAACHLALGKAYPTCLQGGEAMDSVTLLQHGVNDSLIHEDFMIGSKDLSITGRTKDGKELPIFRDGNFVDF